MPETTAATRPQQALSLTSYSDLFRALYGPVRRRWRPKTKEIDTMCSARPLESGQRDELLCLAESDRTLKKTLDMMLFGVKRLDGRAADRPVSGFVRDALRRHPAFRTRSLVEALEHPDRSDDQHAIRILGALNYAALSWNEPSVRLSKNQVATCRANALRCLLLWYRDNLSSRLPLTRIHRHLRAELWEPTIARRTSEPERALALIKDRDPVATAIACTVSESQVAELRRQTQESRAAASRGELRAQQLETQCCDLERQLSDTRNRIAYLTDTLRTERTRHASEKANLHDDYGKLRGHVLHCLEAELSLLKEGLHALRRDPPRVSVMLDHADRVIEGLTREVQRIRGE